MKKALVKFLLGIVLVITIAVTGGCDSKQVMDIVGDIADGVVSVIDDEQAEAETTKKKKNEQATTKSSESKKNDNKDNKDDKEAKDGNKSVWVDEDKEYTSKEEVAKYIHVFKKLPSNFITKNDAQKLGWNSSYNYVGDVAPGKSIGGDKFGNYEGLLPEKKNRQYYECDIDYNGKKRNSKRIIYSNDGLVYYTEDHYKTFELLYGDE